MYYPFMDNKTYIYEYMLVYLTIHDLCYKQTDQLSGAGVPRLGWHTQDKGGT